LLLVGMSPRQAGQILGRVAARPRRPGVATPGAV